MSALKQPYPDLYKNTEIRNDWTLEQALSLFELPMNDLLHKAHTLHRRYFNPNEVQLSTLLNIKSGGCPEDCAYCPQSVRFDTQLEATPLMEVDAVLASARTARENGASRFCMGAAWRSPKERDFCKVLDMVTAIKSLGMESCATLGMLTQDQATRLKQAGLDYYNHNLDTSPDFYKSIISTRDYEDRLTTLSHVREAGLSVCCGGIIGMGESTEDRAGLLLTLANMEKHPESVPVNMLVRVEGTPLGGVEPVIPLEIVRTIAVARVMMPASWLRLSAGRNEMTEELQTLCFYAGANSVFFGEKLLTTDNPEQGRDLDLFRRLGLSLKA